MKSHKQFFYILMFLLLHSGLLSAKDENVLWQATGSDLHKGANGWRETQNSLLIHTAENGKGFILESPEHERHTISTTIPVKSTHPWMVWKLVAFDPQMRYKGLFMPTIAGLQNTSLAQAGSIEPGIWQINMGAFNTLPECETMRSMRIDLYGGSAYFEYIRIVKKTDVELTVESAKPVVEPGDEVVFKVTLSQPAEDVTLSFFHNYCFHEVKINGSNTLQLLPVDPDNPVVWQTTLKINSATPGRLASGKQFTSGSLFFKLTILGGGTELPIWTANTKNFNIVKWE